MDAQKLKARRAVRRAYRVRDSLLGTPERPRLSVFRSNLHIYAQLIDDENGVTVASASSSGKDSGLKYGGNIKAAEEVGKKLAEKAKEKGVKLAQFDRGHYRFHGRVAALARAATKAGLVCTGLEVKKKEHAPPAAEGKPAKKEGGGEKKDKGEKAAAKPAGEKKPKAEAAK